MLRLQWDHPEQLHGIGKYAADAYFIFCLGRWREVRPDDKDLKRYLEWLKATGGCIVLYKSVGVWGGMGRRTCAHEASPD